MSLAEDQVERNNEPEHPFDILSSRMAKQKNPNIAGAIGVIQRFEEDLKRSKEAIPRENEPNKTEEIDHKALVEDIKSEMEK